MEHIPVEYLSKMGKHQVSIHGVKVTAFTADSTAVINKHIADLQSHLKNNIKVVGFDHKRSKDNKDILVLCAASCCIIINMAQFFRPPDSLLKFCKDPDVCFIRREKYKYLLPGVFGSSLEAGVEVGELAARVLKNRSLVNSSLADIAREVGVRYEGPSTATTNEVIIDAGLMFVLSDEQVRVLIKEAFARYQIGHKLISSLY